LHTIRHKAAVWLQQIKKVVKQYAGGRRQVKVFLTPH